MRERPRGSRPSSHPRLAEESRHADPWVSAGLRVGPERSEPSRVAPDGESILCRGAVLRRGNDVPVRAEQVGDAAEAGEESLG